MYNRLIFSDKQRYDFFLESEGHLKLVKILDFLAYVVNQEVVFVVKDRSSGNTGYRAKDKI